MKSMMIQGSLILLAVALTACSSNPFNDILPTSTTTKNEPSGETAMATSSVGGPLEGRMDELDRSKMLHALDKSPGTPTSWMNANTGIHYTVVPTQKVEINGNPYCRRYTTTASKDNREKQLMGTACVGADGNWKAV